MQTDLEKLKIWKRAQDLAQRIYELIQNIPDNFGLKNQIDRSSQHVADNISEMFGSFYYNNKIKLLYEARREAFETINHLIKFKRRKLLNESICDKLCLRYDEEIKAINAYIRYLAKRRDDSNKK